MAQIVIISGPPGAGKTSVCEALCERYDRTVHLKTDWFFEAVRMSYVKPWLPGSARQNETIARAVARAAGAYAENEYAVFIDGVIGPNLLPAYVEELAPRRVPVHFVLLLPSREETIRRASRRDELQRSRDPLTERVDPARIDDLLQAVPASHDWLARAGDFAGCRIDNTAMTAQQAADAVMDACGRGACLVRSAAG